MSTGIDNQRNHQSSVLSSHSRKRSSPISVPPTANSPTPSPMYSEKSKMTQRSRLVKAGLIIAGAFLFLLYLIPSRQSVPNLSGVTDTTDTSTTKCTKPHDPSKPLRQYVLMIDAGSTGSRIHVYRFNNCGLMPELEDEVFKMTPKKEGGSGLSSYKEDAEGAAKSLDVLMDVAMESVPDEYKPCTPVSVKATAGLRLLGEDLSKNILQAVRHRLETVYPFPVVSDEKGGIQILDGSDEGVYAWITTNYLLGKIGGPDETPTAAVFDLGGASTQIVFEPTFDSPSGGMPEELAPGDHKYELQFGGRKFNLYQHSHLKYGLMEARASIHRSIVETKLAASPTDLSWLDQPIPNPCIGPGMQRQVNLTFPEGHALAPQVSVTMSGPKELSAPAQCRGITEKILHKEADCKLAPCSFNGVYQPSLEKTFAKEDVYIFSYFYDRTKPLGMPDSFTLHELQRLTEIVCSGKDNWGIFEGIEGALEELEGRPETCLDLNFMLGLLHTGYEMPLSREVKIAKKIKNNELGWCLGASLPLLSQGSGWTCRIKEVS